MESREYEYKKIRTDQRIIKVETLPEATENSIDLVQYNGVLYRKKITMSLANTTWLFNSEIDIDDMIPATAPYETFIPLAITSNSTNYQAMFVTAGETIYGLYYYTSSNDTNTKVYNSETDTWVNDAYKTIVITGGNGVSNESIYNWLIENATLQSGSVISYSYEPLQNKLTTSSVSDGTIDSYMGFDSQGNIVKATGGGGSGSVEGLPLGFIFSSVLPQSNLNYHQLNGDSLLITDYGDFYTVLTTLISQSWNLSCTANEYAENIAKTGNCGKFVINTTNSDVTGTYTDANSNTTTITVLANSFKIPTLTKFIQGLSSITDLGNSVEAGLPNITGSVGANDNNDYQYTGLLGYRVIQNKINSGALNVTPAVYGIIANGGSSDAKYTSVKSINFDASLSNSIYGNSTTVQPASTKFPYYMVVKNNNSTGLISYLNNLAQAGVQSLGGAVGDITLGNGLKITNNELNTVDSGWVDGQRTLITSTQTTTETSIDMSLFITNYDPNGEYELNLYLAIYLSSGEQILYIGSDIYDTKMGLAVDKNNTTLNYNLITFTIPIKKYLKYKTTITNAIFTNIELIGYRRIK